MMTHTCGLLAALQAIGAHVMTLVILGL